MMYLLRMFSVRGLGFCFLGNYLQLMQREIKNQGHELLVDHRFQWELAAEYHQDRAALSLCQALRPDRLVPRPGARNPSDRGSSGAIRGAVPGSDVVGL